MTTYILGAGPAGMAVADGIIDSATGPFVLIERGSNLGGLAQTIYWEGVGHHDLGPHKIFSLDKPLIERVESLLSKSDWITREKVSSIYMKGVFLPYPPSPFSLAGVFGLPDFIKMVFGYGFARITNLFSPTKPRTFEEDLQGRLGKPLYEILFKPIAEKLWGNPQILDVKLSKGRVQTPSFGELAGRLLGIKKNSEFEALTFRYPKGGLGKIWQAIRSKSCGHGEFLLNHTVTGLSIDGKKITQIRFSFTGNEGVIELKPNDRIVSTLPILQTVKLLENHIPKHLPSIAEQVLSSNDLLLVFIHIDSSSLLDESWVFIPDPEIIFHRLSEQESFDVEMTPNGSIVCCEIMSSTYRPLGQKSEEELFLLITQGLSKMGYKNFKILNKKIVRLPKSYPVFKAGFEKGLAEIINALDQFENFRSIGRQGAFNYIGTLDAMDIGYGYARWQKTASLDQWKKERDRTNHYPVLD